MYESDSQPNSDANPHENTQEPEQEQAPEQAAPRKSGPTGPKTPEGKERSRRNSLRHGCTATTLTLPDENLDEIEAYQNLWIDAYPPETVVEATLINQAVASSLQLDRVQKAHDAITNDQTRYAEPEWDHQRAERLRKAKGLLQEYPEKAVLELKSFGHGVNWLIEQWRTYQLLFEKQGCWTNDVLVRTITRLLGIDPDFIRADAVEGYELRVYAAYARPEPPDEARLKQLQEQMHPEFHGRFGGLPAFDRTVAQTTLRTFLAARIAELEALGAKFAPLDEQSRAEASLRALAPADNPTNKLRLRYQTASASQLNRAVKTLEAIKAARQKEAEKTAQEGSNPSPQNHPLQPSEAGLRNELNAGAPASQPSVPTTNYVRIEGRLHGFDRGGYGQWILGERDGVPPGAVITDVLPFQFGPEPGS